MRTQNESLLLGLTTLILLSLACCGDDDMIKYWGGATVHEVGPGYEPSLYAGTIAYEIWDGYDWEIRYWDGTEVHDITDNGFDDMQASLYGSIIAWAGRPPGSADQIFYVNVTE